MKAPTDEQLLAQHMNGDAAAFRALVDRHHRELHAFIFRFTNSRSAADDVVQDTFVQVHLSAASFDPARRFKPWVFTIAANKARDYLRGRTRRREVPLNAEIGGSDEGGQSFLDLLADEGGDPGERLMDTEKAEIVRKVVDGMPANLAEILVLAYYHKFPYREISDVLDIPLGTVKSRLHAAVGQFGTRYRTLVTDREDEG